MPDKAAQQTALSPAVTVIVPSWNGRQWLAGLLESLEGQTLAPAEVIIVDNGSTDGSLEYLRAEHPAVRVVALGRNTGFAYAVNRGIEYAQSDLLALLNTDVVLDRDWLLRSVDAIESDSGAASVACKMLQLGDSQLIYDAGDVLRRDGACEQRGRFGRDVGHFDEPGEVFGACAGAALYRRRALLEVGSFDERYFAYLEDVDLALRLRLAGWRCRYEPAVAMHAGEGSSRRLSDKHHYLVERNTLILVGRWWPIRWLPLVAYRQASWLIAAARERRMSVHLRGVKDGVVAGLRARRERRQLMKSAVVPIEVVIPDLPIRGPRAAGHRAQIAATFEDR